MSKLYSIKEETLVAIADNVRAITGTTGELTPGEMTTSSGEISTEVDTQTELIEQIQTALEGKAGGSGGVTLPTLDNPAKATDILSGKEAIDGSGNKITGSIATKTSSNLTASGATVTVPAGYYASQATKSVATATQATPSITVSSAGLITASATQTAGYVSAGTKSGTKQLTVQAAKTVTPTTSNQTAVASGRYTTGAITIKGDANLKAENIKSGISIFGVTGTHSGAEDLTAELTEQANLIAQQQTLISNLETALENKAGGGGSGGGSVETCTVTINNSYCEIDFAFYTSVENGVLKASTKEVYANECTLVNVIVGSAVVFRIPDSSGMSAIAVTGGRVLWEQLELGTMYTCISADSVDGVTVDITNDNGGSNPYE